MEGQNCFLDLIWRRGYIDQNATKLPTDSEANKIVRSMPAFTDEPCEIERTMNICGVEIFLRQNTTENYLE